MYWQKRLRIHAQTTACLISRPPPLHTGTQERRAKPEPEPEPEPRLQRINDLRYGFMERPASSAAAIQRLLFAMPMAWSHDVDCRAAFGGSQ
jgi:hypothetical protein